MNDDERLQRKNEFDGNLVMGSHLFNTVTKRESHQKKITLRKKTFIDPHTNELKKEIIIKRVCPLCGKDEGSLIFLKEGFPHVRCNSCGMVYVNCLLRKDALNSLYENEDTYSEILTNEVQKKMDRLKFSYFLDLIEEKNPNKGTILDIGCGPGFFLTIAMSRGWSVTGCEFNQSCIPLLKKANISVIDRPIEEANIYPGSFNCVTLFTVLEHIPDPKNLLNEVHKILVKGGFVGILVPNIDALVNRILHEKSPTFSGDVHINLFSSKTMIKMLEETGFEIVECETILTNIGLINNYMNYEDPLFGEGKPIFPFLTPEFIHNTLMGYLLFILAKAK